MNRRHFLSQTATAALAVPFLGFPHLQSRQEAQVVVLGAGLAGLYAARILKQAGLRVTVLEGRSRVGGRVHTLRDVTGQPEGGGWTVGAHYARFLKLCEAVSLNLTEVSPENTPQGTLFFVNGERIQLQDWQMAKPNQLSDSDRQTPPPALLSKYLRAGNPLKDAKAWMQHDHSALDISLFDFLQSKGASAEALRLMNIAPNTNDLKTSSLLWALRDDFRRKTGAGQKFYRITGGNSLLPEALARDLNVLHHKKVKQIQPKGDQATVWCEDGSRYQADFVLSTLPYSVLRKIRVKPYFSPMQAEAVKKLPYTTLSQVFLRIEQPFWLDDGMPLAMWTDTAIERVLPFHDEKGQVRALSVWMDGKNAAAFDQKTPDAQTRFVLETLAQVRPSMQDAVSVSYVQQWAKDPFSLGAYHHFAPNQITRFGAKLAIPHERMHFAGEHTAIESSGMEAALESAERATQEILARI